MLGKGLESTAVTHGASWLVRAHSSVVGRQGAGIRGGKRTCAPGRNSTFSFSAESAYQLNCFKKFERRLEMGCDFSVFVLN